MQIATTAIERTGKAGYLPALAAKVQYGAWFDYQSWEIGNKCAWVGDGLQVPGAPFNMVGNDGAAYPVQTLWSNVSLNGAGYCVGGL